MHHSGSCEIYHEEIVDEWLIDVQASAAADNEYLVQDLLAVADY